MNNFTEEEINAAKATRDMIIKDGPKELRAIYMAGEICMWDELRKNKKSEYIPLTGPGSYDE